MLFSWLRHRRRRIAAVGVASVAGLTGLLAMGVVLAHATPGWWAPAPADDPATRQTAEALENGVVNQLHAWRAKDASAKPESWRSEPWTVSLSASDANAWIAASLPKWLANHQKPIKLPPEVSELQVGFASGVVRIGARVRHEGASHVLSASVRPEIREDGSLWLAATWVRLGRMPMPASWLLDRALGASGDASGLDSPQTVAVARVLSGLEPAAAAPELKLADGRRVRLLKIEPRDGQLWLTCRTEGKP